MASWISWVWPVSRPCWGSCALGYMCRFLWYSPIIYPRNGKLAYLSGIINLLSHQQFHFFPSCRFASGYGLFMFTQGNGMFLIGPIVGYIRDRTQDYILVFHILNVFMALCAIPWIIEVLIVKFRRRSKIERNNVGEQSNGNGTLEH